MADNDPKDEASIRADERFRMALYTSDAANQMVEKARSVGAQADAGIALIVEIMRAHAQDIMVSGADYSAAIDLLPDSVREALEVRKGIIEEAAAQQPLITAPLYDERDLTEPGAFVQLSLFPDGEDDGSGNDNGGGYLN